MTPDIYTSPHAAVDELPMLHGVLSTGVVVATTVGLDLHPVLKFDGEERRSGDDRRSDTDRRGDEDRRGDDRLHHLPRRVSGDRREGKGIGGRRATD